MTAADRAAELATIARHRTIAHRAARGFVAKWRSWDRSEIEQVALIGLFDWIRRHPDDSTPGWREGAFQRSRGRVLDELRAQDWFPRSARRRAEAQGVTLRIARCDDADPNWADTWAGHAETPEEIALRNDALAEAWRAPLDARAERIVRLRHERERGVADIATELGISEPRVCQLYAGAVARMFARVCADEDAPPTTTEGDADGQRSRREALRAQGRCWQCSAPLTGSVMTRGHQRGQPHTTCESCRAKKRAYRSAKRHASTPSPNPGARRMAATRSRYRAEGRCRCGREREGSRNAACADCNESRRRNERWLTKPRGGPVMSTLPEDGIDLRAELGRYQSWLIEQALIRTGGNKARAARLLGIQRTCLVELLKNGSGLIAKVERGEPSQ